MTPRPATVASAESLGWPALLWLAGATPRMGWAAVRLHRPRSRPEKKWRGDEMQRRYALSGHWATEGRSAV